MAAAPSTTAKQSRLVRILRYARSLLVLLGTGCFGAGSVQAVDGTFSLELEGRRIEGRPLAWSTQRISLLSRDGRLYHFDPDRAKNARQVSERFVSYSAGEMRAMLHREFGNQFEVSGTGHFLVVHPRGTRDQWAMKFEELYRSFVHYFQVRGFRLDAPAFPLVAVVFPSQSDYLEYARRFETAVSAQVVGFYSGTSNRILMYDAGHGRSSMAADNLETLIHEAAHQIAFNTGIHDRYAPPPRWVCEGLGMLFEARGVHNSQAYKNLSDRVHTYRLQRYRLYQQRRGETGLVELLTSDRLFKADPDAAYAESWALTFFLSETRPRQYYEYLKLTAAGSSDDSPEQRLAPFVKAFGRDLRLLEAHYQRFINSLP